jgi:hypothetical protein
VAILVAFLVFEVLAAQSITDSFAFFEPSVVLNQDDRRRLEGGEPVARIVPAQDRQVAVFAAVPVAIDGDRFVAWIRRIEELKKSRYVVAIGRFSQPPRIEDLADLALDDDELSEVMSCRPGECDLKLAAGEMRQLQSGARSAGDDWKPALQRAFRHLVLQRVAAYLTDGHAALPPYEDNSSPVWPASRFAVVLGHSVFLTERVPRFAEHLSRFPRTPTPDIESFVYWSKERLAGKANISATHVNILRGHEPGLPDALTAGKEIFSTHYVTASLGVTAIIRGGPGSPNYLAYLNRSEVDVLGGPFGGLVKWFMQRRLKSEAAGVLQDLRKRLEGGEPPGS